MIVIFISYVQTSDRWYFLPGTINAGYVLLLNESLPWAVKDTGEKEQELVLL